MFSDGSGRLTNVPAVKTLRQAIKAGQTLQEQSCDADPNSLMDHIAESVRRRVAAANLTPLENGSRKFILEQFAARSKPPTMTALMKKMKLSSIREARRIIERLATADLLTKEGAKIISAYPFSAKATRHRVAFKDGHEVYAMCATDALGIHFMLNLPITVRSSCPACEKEIVIAIDKGRVVSSNTDGIVQFVSSSGKCGCTANIYCPYMNFFCSREHANAWREENHELGRGEFYSLQKTLEYGRHIFGPFLE